MIAIYDPNRKSLRTLVKMLKKALPKYSIESFTSLEQCMKYVEEKQVDIVFLDMDSIKPPNYVEFVVRDLRRKMEQIDFVLLTEVQRLSERTAGWALETQISSVLRKPYQYDALIDTLANIWYHKIPEYDPSLKMQNQLNSAKYRIAVYDPDRRTKKQIEKMLDQVIPDYPHKGFTSWEKCAKYIVEGDIDIVFLDIDSLMPLYHLQEIVYGLREDYTHIDVVLLTEKGLTNEIALWAIRTQISPTINRPYQYDELIEALNYLWYHPIPEQDIHVKT